MIFWLSIGLYSIHIEVHPPVIITKPFGLVIFVIYHYASKIEKKIGQSVAALRNRWVKENIDRSEEVFYVGSAINVDELNEDNKQEDFFNNKISVLNTGNLLEIIKQETSLRSLSMLVFLSLMYFGIPRREIDSFSKDIGALTAETCHKSSANLIEQDLDELLVDNRSGKHSEGLVAYERGDSYKDVLKMYFSSICKANVVSHRQITNSKLDD
ncbi:unnamed protein product [Adineta ricciae]|uniref:Uncharacterized protein n=2 Tax=Adineta ricciae TaxID=249248 RepID=A0A815VGA2_ADIRI|nr:unnamed protein product [Adineta ricciae]